MSLLSLFSDNPSSNISYYLLIAAYLHNVTCGTRYPLVKLGLDNNVEPRETLARLEKSAKIPVALLRKLQRHSAAQQNGFENLGMMAAAVVAGNQANLGAKYMNRMTAMYLVLRILFTTLYVNTTRPAPAFLRSLSFFGAAACFIVTLIKSSRTLKV